MGTRLRLPHTGEFKQLRSTTKNYEEFKRLRRGQQRRERQKTIGFTEQNNDAAREFVHLSTCRCRPLQNNNV